MHNQKKDNNKFKNKNNQNCQRIELYGNLTTTELKKKHSSVPVRGTEMGSQAEQTGGKAAARGWGWARWHWRTRTGEAVAGGLGGPTFACS